jgi:uncharacterized membrane protein (UPF0127 family)
MPSNVTAKIKSALKRREVIALLFVAVAFGCLYLAARDTSPRTLHVSRQSYSLEIADNSDEQQKGLSDRDSMPRDHGMLFAFHYEEKLCFWMKDMHFPLDMIWLDAGHRVVHLEQNLSPDTYPDQFCSHTPARYVIELNAGEVARAGIRKGQNLNF